MRYRILSDEKKELLLFGSKAVGKDNWEQERNEEYGKIFVAMEWEKRIDRLNQSGTKYNSSIFF